MMMPLFALIGSGLFRERSGPFSRRQLQCQVVLSDARKAKPLPRIPTYTPSPHITDESTLLDLLHDQVCLQKLLQVAVIPL